MQSLDVAEAGGPQEVGAVVKPRLGSRLAGYWTLTVLIVLVVGSSSLVAYFLQSQQRELRTLSQEVGQLKREVEEIKTMTVEAEQGVQRLRVDVGRGGASWSRQQRQTSAGVSGVHLSAREVPLPQQQVQADCEDSFLRPKYNTSSPSSSRLSRPYNSVAECRLACLEHSRECFGIEFTRDKQCRLHMQSGFSRETVVEPGTVQYIRQCCGGKWFDDDNAHGHISKQGFQANHTDREYRYWEPTYFPDQGRAAVQFNPTTGRVRVSQTGLYLIHTQIVYYNGGPISGHVLEMSREGEEQKHVLARCIQHTSPTDNSSDSCANQVARYFTCTTSNVHRLQAGDVMVLKTLWPRRTVRFAPNDCFYDVFKLY